MKTTAKYILLSFATLALLSACSLKEAEDMNSAGDGFWIAYADVQAVAHHDAFTTGETNPLFHLIADNGTVLEVMDFNYNYTTVPTDLLVDGTRVVASFGKYGESLAGGVTHWQVHLYNIERVLTKNPATGDGTALGNDPIDLRRMWLGGKYLNATFNFRYGDSGVTHGINLWYDAERSDAQNIYLELRHNAWGDGVGKEAFGRVSFNVASPVFPASGAVTLHISWTDYAGQTHRMTKLYGPGINENPEDLPLSNGGLVNMN